MHNRQIGSCVSPIQSYDSYPELGISCSEMKRIAPSLALCLFLCSLANAKDSLWGLGDNGRIAISFLEHRAGASLRVIDVTLIVGGWLLAGSVKEPSDGHVEDRPISLAAKNATFEGTFNVEFGGDTNKIKLKGKLTLRGSAFILDESIDCKTMIGL